MSFVTDLIRTVVNTFSVGDKTAGTKTILLDTGAASPPGVRWNGTAMQYSNGGGTWSDLGAGGGLADADAKKFGLY